MDNPFQLDRFVTAQSAVYPQVLIELRAGEKRGHWIWFIFPQLKGLGHSAQSEYYGIGSLAEAAAYSQHPILSPRLEECTHLVNAVEKRTIGEILGYPDDLKFRSSMTLFSRAAANPAIFNEALRKYFHGDPDPLTLRLMGGEVSH
jgi:uncharacterized protein (DUF1810 family)